MNEIELMTNIYKGAKSLSDYGCKMCEEDIKEGNIIRTHFHGSDVGKCKRYVYYSLYHGKNKKIENGKESLFLFAGHLFEAMQVRALELSGNYSSISCNDGQDISVSKKLEFYIDNKKIQVEVIGHYDLVLDNKYLVEFKAVKSRSFNDVFIKKNLQDRQQYYGQVQFYMDAMPQIEKGFLVGINRETCEIAEPIEIKRDYEFISSIYETYAKIIYYGVMKNQIPTRDHATKYDYECRFCSYKEQCWENKLATEFEV